MPSARDINILGVFHDQLLNDPSIPMPFPVNERREINHFLNVVRHVEAMRQMEEGFTVIELIFRDAQDDIHDLLDHEGM